MPEILGLIIGTIITLMIFSYLLGDNVLYRWALALLVGSAVGYATGVAVDFVWQQWITPALSNTDPATNLTYTVPLLLGSLLLLKGFPPVRFLGKISVLGNIPLGYLVGVGAGVAISGALTGSLIPQVLATGQGIRLDAGILELLRGVVVLISTLSVLLLFAVRPKAQPLESEKPSLSQRSIRQLGGFFLVVGLGAAFAGAITSALTAMVIRLSQISDLADWLMSSVGR
jgi:hypothetical protein